jgi:ATP-dependent helicase/nuclease subunit A
VQVDAASFVPDLLRLHRLVLADDFQQSLELVPDARNDNLGDDNESRLEAAVGTLVHRVLELIARDGVNAWNAQRVAGLQAAYQRWLQQQGHSASEAAKGAQTAVAAVSCTLLSSDGLWVLGQQQEADVEAAWSSQNENVAVHHVIDRIFIADGERWIVDYKTVHMPADASADFLVSRAENYRPQLARYGKLFGDDGLRVRLAIFYPVQGKLVELR